MTYNWPSPQTSPSPTELIAVEINTIPKIVIVCIYIPPSPSKEQIDYALNSLSNLQTDSDIIITGDFNCPDAFLLSIRQKSHSFSHTQTNPKRLFSILKHLSKSHRTKDHLPRAIVLSSNPRIFTNSLVNSSARSLPNPNLYEGNDPKVFKHCADVLVDWHLPNSQLPANISFTIVYNNI